MALFPMSHTEAGSAPGSRPHPRPPPTPPPPGGRERPGRPENGAPGGRARRTAPPPERLPGIRRGASGAPPEQPASKRARRRRAQMRLCRRETSGSLEVQPVVFQLVDLVGAKSAFARNAWRHSSCRSLAPPLKTAPAALGCGFGAPCGRRQKYKPLFSSSSMRSPRMSTL